MFMNSDSKAFSFKYLVLMNTTHQISWFYEGGFLRGQIIRLQTHAIMVWHLNLLNLVSVNFCYIQYGLVELKF
jgi:hypothetical protein